MHITCLAWMLFTTTKEKLETKLMAKKFISASISYVLFV